MIGAGVILIVETITRKIMAKIIGIDPGTHTGMAIVLDGKLTDLHTCSFWECIAQIDIHSDAELIVLELPNTRTVWRHKKMTDRTKSKVSVDVGCVIREAELIIEYLRLNDINFKTSHPAGKIDQSLFNRITGWTGKSNQHTRDAGMLAWTNK